MQRQDVIDGLAEGDGSPLQDAIRETAENYGSYMESLTLEVLGSVMGRQFKLEAGLFDISEEADFGDIQGDVWSWFNQHHRYGFDIQIPVRRGAFLGTSRIYFLKEPGEGLPKVGYELDVNF